MVQRSDDSAITRIDAVQDVITLVNVFITTPARQQELIDHLQETTEQVMRDRRGFVSANIHASLDGTRVVNYAQWRSREDFEAMQQNPAAQEDMSRASEIANDFDPNLYRVSSVHRAR